MLKKFLIGTFALALMLVAVSSADAAATLRVGSKGADVITVQTIVGVTADSKFGPMTAAAVKAWQANHGLVADGIVGPATWAAMMAGGSVTTPVVPGCPAGALFNTMTGASCGAVSTLPIGCTSTAGFSPATGVACSTVVTPSTLPAGCTSTIGFSTTTGVSCAAGTEGSGVLTGGAGDLTITSSNTNIESNVKEDSTAHVLGLKVKATDSDIEVKNIKIVIANPTGTGSTTLSKYLKEVNIYLGTTKVGSADISEFTKSGLEYSKSISLSGAIVKNGDNNARLYVSVKTNPIVDNTLKKWDITVGTTAVRFQDGTGVIMTGGPVSAATNNFGFEDATADDKLTVSSATNNPESSPLKVSDSTTSDSILIAVAKFKAGSSSSDISVITLPVSIDVSAAAATSKADTIFNDVTLKVGSKTYSYDSTSGYTTAGTSGTVVYNFEFDSDEFVIDSGNSVNVEVYAKFNKQIAANYLVGTKVKASITGANVSIMGADDLMAEGTFVGKEHTLMLSPLEIASVTSSVEGGATAGFIDFQFKVTAGDDSYNLLGAGITHTYAGNITGGPAAGVLTKISGDATMNAANDYTINSGETATFRMRYAFSGGTAGQYGEITLNKVANQTIDKLSPTLLLKA